VKDRNYFHDKELIEQLKQSLELAYKSLWCGDESGNPTNIRMRWLSAARRIERYRELKTTLKTSIHKTICDEQEEYWSDKIHSLLQRISDEAFFKSIDPENMVEEEIDIKSAAIVFSFSVWKEDRSDPLDSVDLESIIQAHKLYSPIYRSFWYYVQRSRPELAKKIERNKEKLNT